MCGSIQSLQPAMLTNVYIESVASPSVTSGFDGGFPVLRLNSFRQDKD
jgi:hypothetical protein